jgi:hypothetical protein
MATVKSYWHKTHPTAGTGMVILLSLVRHDHQLSLAYSVDNMYLRRLLQYVGENAWEEHLMLLPWRKLLLLANVARLLSTIDAKEAALSVPSWHVCYLARVHFCCCA